MLYSINKIASKIAINPIYQNQKIEIIHFFQIKNMVDNLGISNIYTSDLQPQLFLEESDIAKVFSLAQNKFNLPFDYVEFYEGKNGLTKVSEDQVGIFKHNVKSNIEVENIVDSNNENSTYGKKEKEKKDKKAAELEASLAKLKQEKWAEFDKATNLKRDFTQGKLLSIDFEFYLKNKNHTITELGLTIFENNQLKSEHYLVEEFYQMKKNKNLQNSFQFGETKIVKLEEIKKILKEHLKDATYILFHEQREDYEILNGLNIIIKPECAVIDTQLCYKRYFRERGTLPNGEPLEVLLDSFKVNYKHLHNAGNDSYYTLLLLNAMSQSLENKNVTKIKKNF